MGYLALSDDELALLRFTCDLFFVEESPLYYLEAEAREPADYEAAYQSLIDKGVVDPHGFRITDDALNRLAPITECDARVIHLVEPPGAPIAQTDYYLLEEIAVEYVQGESGHAVGTDLDPDELVEHLARRVVPRKAGGDLVDVHLETLEYLALAQLARHAREREGMHLDLDEAKRRLSGATLPEVSVARAPFLVGSARPRSKGAREARPAEEITTTAIGAGGWKGALEGLLHKGVLRKEGGTLRLRAGLVDLLRSVTKSPMHTFVRYDFGEDEWLVRETTFLPTSGSLFSLRAAPEGGVHLLEIDGDRLLGALRAAVGPLPRAQEAPEPRRLRDLLLGLS